MIYLKEYYNYDDKVAEICDKYNIKNWSIRDGLVDVYNQVILYRKGLAKLPLNFGSAGDNFYFHDNRITSLEGCPKEVVGNFSCGSNYLTSLKGGPVVVGGYFHCDVNKISSLEGAPVEVGGDFYCRYNIITTLEHMPKIRGTIHIEGNPLPKEILNLSSDQIKKVVEEQDFYEIWRNGQLFLPRWRELKIDLGIN